MVTTRTSLACMEGKEVAVVAEVQVAPSGCAASVKCVPGGKVPDAC